MFWISLYSIFAPLQNLFYSAFALMLEDLVEVVGNIIRRH